MPAVRFVGAYRVDVPSSEYDAAMNCHDDEEYVRAELGSLALLEIEVTGMPKDTSITEFKQPHTKYVPYDESFFDRTTLAPLEHEHYKLPDATDFRVAFYLHFYDPAQPLSTPWGAVPLGPLSDVPSHLQGKSYVFWD
jgi:hypothetical protein